MLTQQPLMMTAAPSSSADESNERNRELRRREQSLPPASSFERFITRRRIAISLTLFTTILAIDVILLDVRPRNLFNYADIGTICGLLGVVVGLALRSWSAGTLHKKKQLTQVGPYSLMRNPLYVGSFLMMIGFCCLVHDMHTIWIVAGPMAWIYWLQVRQEERLLEALYPTEWNEYAASTPRFFPRRLIAARRGNWSLDQWLSNHEYKAILASALGLVGLWAWHYYTL